MRNWIVCAMALALAGCAPSTVIELRDQTAPLVFIVDKPYQRVFKEIRAELHRCVTGGFAFAKSDIDAQLYPDLKEGEIAVRYNNMGDRSVFLHVELKDASGVTKATAYSASFGTWEDYGERLKQFSQAGTPMC